MFINNIFYRSYFPSILKASAEDVVGGRVGRTTAGAFTMILLAPSKVMVDGRQLQHAPSRKDSSSGGKPGMIRFHSFSCISSSAILAIFL